MPAWAVAASLGEISASVDTNAVVLCNVYKTGSTSCITCRWQLFNRDAESNVDVGVPDIAPGWQPQSVRQRQRPSRRSRRKKGRRNEEKREASKRNGRATLSASATASAAAAAYIDADLSSISVRTASISEIDGRTASYRRASHHRTHLSHRPRRACAVFSSSHVI